jgi:hypothetical protein
MIWYVLAMIEADVRVIIFIVYGAEGNINIQEI